MSISDKIEEIRQKPEHIRLRYVWLFVGICMIFIIIVWIFSIKNMFQFSAPADQGLTDLKNQANNSTGQLPSLKDLLDKNSQALEEGIKASGNQSQPDNSNSQNNNTNSAAPDSPNAPNLPNNPKN